MISKGISNLLGGAGFRAIGATSILVGAAFRRTPISPLRSSSTPSHANLTPRAATMPSLMALHRAKIQSDLARRTAVCRAERAWRKRAAVL